ncbi:MAG: condensation domain-containing protein [Thermoguttaceae bacterium]
MRLTPFEEYMVLDGSEVHPMNCFVRVRLRGRLDRERLARAVTAAATLHPLLHAKIVSPRRDVWEWELDPKPNVPIIWHENDTSNCDGEPTFPAPTPFDFTRETTMRLHVFTRNNNETGDETDIVTEFHHAACDGVGIYQFLEDLFFAYENDSPTTTSDVNKIVNILSRRNRFAATWWRWWGSLPSQTWGLLRAWTFLVNRVQPIVAPNANANTSTANTAIIETSLDTETTSKLRHRVRQSHLALNDVLLAAAYQTIVEWCDVVKRPLANDRYIRIAVPTNLRLDSDELTTAANRVSMVFLDRRPSHIRSAEHETFVAAIHREMSHIKRHRLGWAFLWGLGFFKRVFGGFRMMMKQRRCWSSCVLTNHGEAMRKTPLAMRDGKIVICSGTDAELEMTELSGAPPLRAFTVFGINAVTYAGRLFLALHYDRNEVTRAEAETFLSMLRERVVA